MKQAFINEIKEKETKAGKMFDFIMSNGEKVGAGKFPPKGMAVGDYVQYESSANGNFLNLVSGSMSKLAPPAGVPAPSSQPGFVPSGDKRQDTISKQAALNSALTFVALLHAADALPLPAKTKAGEKADIIQSIVDMYTAHYFKQATGQEMTFADGGPKPIVPESGDDLRAAEGSDNWNEE